VQNPLPDPHSSIWRYMDFPRFVAMLEYQGLFFTIANQMDDRFEGSLMLPTPENLERLRAVLKQQGIAPERDYDNLVQQLRRCVAISCWHSNEDESAAMWKLYSAQQQAIAIRTTYSKLQSALSRNPSVVLTPVRYVTNNKDDAPFDSIFSAFLYKERSFQFEHEVRAIITDLHCLHPNGSDAPTAREGNWVQVDLETLIDTIVIAPDAERWYFDLVRRVTKHYGLSKPVQQSRLARPFPEEKSSAPGSPCAESSGRMWG